MNKILYSPSFELGDMKHVAVIDLGTNTFHLLIAAVSKTDLNVLHKEKISVKIGEGGISHGKITTEAQQRALQALGEFKKTINKFQVDQIFASATSAFRNASNGKSLATKILEQTGISVNIISGDNEANLIYLGVMEALDLGPSNGLIMDIGGGSAEFIIANQKKAHWMQSFEIGAQRLLDLFHHHDPIYPQEIERLETFLDERMIPLVTAMEQFNPRVLIGSSGTFDTLSEIFCMQQGITKQESPEQPLTIRGYQRIHQEIISKTRSERLQIPGMIEMRVDMIVVASCMINYLLRRFTMQDIRVSAYALKEGVLSQVIKQIREQMT